MCSVNPFPRPLAAGLDDDTILFHKAMFDYDPSHGLQDLDDENPGDIQIRDSRAAPGALSTGSSSPYFMGTLPGAAMPSKVPQPPLAPKPPLAPAGGGGFHAVSNASPSASSMFPVMTSPSKAMGSGSMMPALSNPRVSPITDSSKSSSPSMAAIPKMTFGSVSPRKAADTNPSPRPPVHDPLLGDFSTSPRTPVIACDDVIFIKLLHSRLQCVVLFRWNAGAERGMAVLKSAREMAQSDSPTSAQSSGHNMMGMGGSKFMPSPK